MQPYDCPQFRCYNSIYPDNNNKHPSDQIHYPSGFYSFNQCSTPSRLPPQNPFANLQTHPPHAPCPSLTSPTPIPTPCEGVDIGMINLSMGKMFEQIQFRGTKRPRSYDEPLPFPDDRDERPSKKIRNEIDLARIEELKAEESQLVHSGHLILKKTRWPQSLSLNEDEMKCRTLEIMAEHSMCPALFSDFHYPSQVTLDPTGNEIVLYREMKYDGVENVDEMWNGPIIEEISDDEDVCGIEAGTIGEVTPMDTDSDTNEYEKRNEGI